MNVGKLMANVDSLVGESGMSFESFTMLLSFALFLGMWSSFDRSMDWSPANGEMSQEGGGGNRRD